MAEFVYVDYLGKEVEREVKKFIERMEANHPKELTSLPKERLVYNLTDRATGIVRQGITEAIKAACYDLLISIKWAEQHPTDGTYKKGGKQ